MASHVQDLLQVLSNRGIATSGQIQSDLEVSQATVSRLLRAAGDQVYRLGRGPSTAYARVHDLFTIMPLFRIDSLGVAEHLADVAPLSDGSFHVATRSTERWLAGESKGGVFDGLPYFLDDIRPQGFLGRQIARAIGTPYPTNPERWGAVEILTWIRDYGHDLPGDLVLGTRALNAASNERPVTRPEDYPRLVVDTLGGEQPGSSAGGEQPKFAARTETGNVLVKFSGRGEGAETRRWRDILVAEHHALAVLGEHSIETNESQLFESDGRTFLEVVRFDRVGPDGRLPMLSLRAVDAEFVGVGENWIDCMERLVRMSLVPSDDLERARFLQLFGHWTGNSDMHLGNLSLRPTESGFELLPVYDMAPMLWAPTRGELPGERNITAPVRDPRFADLWQESAELALQYWCELESEPRISDDFRSIAVAAKERIRELLR